MADAQQPDLDQQQPALPRAYINFAAGNGTPLELALTLGYREQEHSAAVVAPVVMSWEFVPILIKLLQDQLDGYQAKMGPVRDLQQPRTVEEAS